MTNQHITPDFGGWIVPNGNSRDKTNHFGYDLCDYFMCYALINVLA